MKKIMILLMMILIIGCTSEPKSLPTIAIQPTVETIPEPTIVIQPTVEPIPECYVSPIAQNVTCRIARAYCSYKPNVKGDPTFCNDAPYPNHNFTLLRWGENWNYLNGKCLLVTGFNHLYKGKPQIIATNISQVKICD